MESAGVPVLRRHRGERRRGSIKSRIVELSKVSHSHPHLTHPSISNRIKLSQSELQFMARSIISFI